MSTLKPQHMFLWRNKKPYPRIITKYSFLSPLIQEDTKYSETCVRKPHLRLTLVVDVER